MTSLDLLSLPCADFTGGLGHRRFQPSEFLGVFGDRSERVHRGGELPVISLAGGGGTGSSVTAEVELPDGPRSGFARHELWLRGQWNHQEHLRGEDIKLGAIMPTFGWFQVRLDEVVVFDGPVLFWNYRQWHFWPRWSLRVPAEALQPGRRRLTIVNRTPPLRLPFATGYCCPIQPAIADGRLFIRLNNGIACCDLRNPETKAK